MAVSGAHTAIRVGISLVPLVIMSVIMGVASPYWMKAIEPSVVTTTGQATSSMKTKHYVLRLKTEETVSMNSASAEQKDSAAEQKTGGQK